MAFCPNSPPFAIVCGKRCKILHRFPLDGKRWHFVSILHRLPWSVENDVKFYSVFHWVANDGILFQYSIVCQKMPPNAIDDVNSSLSSFFHCFPPIFIKFDVPILHRLPLFFPCKTMKIGGKSTDGIVHV